MEIILIIIFISFVAGIIAGFGGSSAFIPIVGLIILTNLNPAQISGTIATSFFIATLFGTYLYWKSGNHNIKILSIIIPPGIFGTQIGVQINSYINDEIFTIITGIIAIVLGLLLLKPYVIKSKNNYNLNLKLIKGKIILISIGLFVGIIAGITGIGGIPIIVPTLLLLQVNPLTSIASGFAVATANTFVTSITYTSQNVVQFEYVLYIGLSFGLAQTIGWKISHKISFDRLKLILGIFNILLGGYLII